MYTKDNNWNNFVTHMIEECYAKSEDTLLEHMALIPSKSREIIEKRWGLIDKVYYSSFEQLNEQMGIDNARELYFGAMRDLFNAEYAAIGMKRYNLQTISHWNEVVALGMLFVQQTTNATTTEKVEMVAVAKKDNPELLKRRFEEFENISTSLYRWLKRRTNFRTLEDILNDFKENYSIDHFYYLDRLKARDLIEFLKSVGIVENEGKDLCFALAKKFNLYYLLSNEDPKQTSQTQNSTSDILNYPLAQLDNISGNLRKLLNSAHLNTLGDLVNLGNEVVVRVPGLGYRLAMELMRALELIGIVENEGKEIYTSMAKHFKLHYYITAEKQDTTISTQNSTSDILKRRLIEFDNLDATLRNPLYYKFGYRTLEDFLNGDTTELLKKSEFYSCSGRPGIELISFLKANGITQKEDNGTYVAIANYYHLHKLLPSESN